RDGAAKWPQYSDELEKPALRYAVGKVADLKYQIRPQERGEIPAGGGDFHTPNGRRQRVVGYRNENEKSDALVEIARQRSRGVFDARQSRGKFGFGMRRRCHCVPHMRRRRRYATIGGHGLALGIPYGGEPFAED